MENRKKILFVGTKSVLGGAQKYIYDLASNIPPVDYEAIVAAGGTGKLKKRIEEKNLRYIEIKNFERDIGLIKDLLAFAEIVRLITKIKPSVVHLNGSKAGVIGGIASKLSFSKTRVVYSTHGLPYFEERPKWQKFFIFWSLKISMLFHNHVIAISRFDYENALHHRLIGPSKLLYIPIRINRRNYSFLPKNEAKSIILSDPSALGKNPAEKTIMVGAIAEFTRNKGLKYLIDAVKIMRAETPFHIIIIGWGEEKSRLKKQIADNKLIKKISIIDGTGDDYKFIRAFDIFVLPSVKEGLPYTLLECDMAGIPAIATDAGGSPEIIKNNETGFIVKKASSEELAIALEKLINNENLRNRFSQNMLKKTENEFSFADMLSDTLQAYN